MSDFEPTNQTEEAPAQAPVEAEVDYEADTAPQETESEHDGEPVDDGEDVDYEGKKYRLPKELKDALLRQSDYTRKTQEVADQRRALEAERQTFAQQAQQQQEYIEDFAELKSLEKQLKQYDGVDWTRFSQEDPVACQQAMIQRQMLMEAHQAKAMGIQQKDQQRTQETQREYAKRMEEGRAQLSKEIPGWGADKAKSLGEFALSVGYSKQQLEGATVQDIKLLHDAYQWRQHVSKQRAAVKEPVPEAKPITQVVARSAPAKGPSDRQSMDEWMKARNKEIRRA